MEGTKTGDTDENATTRLVIAAQRGDAFAMDELMTLLSPYVSRLCASVTMENAADATQEVLIVVFRRIGQLKEPAALFSWVRTIAVRESVRIAKERQREIPTNSVGEVPDPGDLELHGDIKDVLRRLTPEQRVVLLLRHVEGLEEQDVARILEVPVGTVRSRLFRARLSFRRAWR